MRTRKTMQRWLYLSLLLLSWTFPSCIKVEIEPATPTEKRQKRLLIGSAFVRSGLLVESDVAEVKPRRSSAPKPEPAIRFGAQGEAPLLFPVSWHPGQQFETYIRSERFMLAAPLNPVFYPLLKLPLEEGADPVVFAQSRLGNRFAYLPRGAVPAVFDLPSGQPFVIGSDKVEHAIAAEFSEDERLLYVAQTHDLQAIEVETGRVLWSYSLPQLSQKLNELASSPLGKSCSGLRGLWVLPEGCVWVQLQGSGGGGLVTLNALGQVTGAFNMPGQVEQVHPGAEGNTLAFVISEQKGSSILLMGKGQTPSVLGALEGVERPTLVALSAKGEHLFMTLAQGQLSHYEHLDGQFVERPTIEVEGNIRSISVGPQAVYVLSEKGSSVLQAFNFEGQKQWQYGGTDLQHVKVSADGRYILLYGAKASEAAADKVELGEQSPRDRGDELLLFDLNRPGRQAFEPYIRRTMRGNLYGQLSFSQNGLWIGAQEVPRERPNGGKSGFNRVWLLL